ncbi:ATP-binding protein [Geojedonia litorea]|uniref:histidine kinase n=1 Tax=Geojedonia litorea TaxID=1268269 RepID=A0ABV9N3N6_9FLAO
MRWLFVIWCILIGLETYSQEETVVKSPGVIERDSILHKLHTDLERSRKQGDINEEILRYVDLIDYSIKTFGSNTETNIDVLKLEGLVKKNAHLEAAIRAEPYLYKFMAYLKYDQQKIDQAINYLSKSISKAKETNQEKIYLLSSIEMGKMQGYLDFQKGLDILNDLEGVVLDFDDHEVTVRLYMGFMVIHLITEQWEKALHYNFKSLSDRIYPAFSAYNYIIRAECFNRLNIKLDSAIYYSKKGLEVANYYDILVEQVRAHYTLKNTYTRLDDYKSALHHYEKLYEFQANDYKRGFKTANEVGEFVTDLIKTESEYQNLLSEQKIANQRTILWIVSCGLLLLGVLIIYVFNRLKLIRKQNKIIEREKQRAEESERHKEQFLANMSHEIRTPMHAISGMLNNLRRQTHPQHQVKYLNAMKVSADNLLVLLNDALDMSKIESGSLDIQNVEMNAIEIIQNVENIFKYKADEKGLKLAVKISDNFPITIIGDPNRFNQVLINLVSNAIKFTENGSVNISLSQYEDKMRIVVEDTGIGIAQEEIEIIFESFKQGNKVVKGKMGGTGLGLAISKQLIEMQNGTIWVESKVGQGSRFYVELPLTIGSQEQDVKTAFSESKLKQLGNELEGLKILIAEDNEFNVMVVKDDLNWYIPNVELTIVYDGNQAIDAFKSNNYDLVLMDVQMPERNGYEATREIRRLEAQNLSQKPTPIIAMTASLLKEQIDKCYVAGMDAYIPKPYKLEVLISTLHNVLKT